MSEIITPATQATDDEKNIAVVVHLSSTLFTIFPGLIVWLLKKDDSVFIGDQARESLNFQITLLIVYFVCWILAFILVGFLFMGIVWLGNILLCIFAGLAASKGQYYRYPFTLRFIS